MFTELDQCTDKNGVGWSFASARSRDLSQLYIRNSMETIQDRLLYSRAGLVAVKQNEACRSSWTRLRKWMTCRTPWARMHSVSRRLADKSLNISLVMRRAPGPRASKSLPPTTNTHTPHTSLPESPRKPRGSTGLQDKARPKPVVL